jgi:formate transporter
MERENNDNGTLLRLAVWMTYSARSTLDRIAVIILPISAFVAAGFEHSVENMYFIPAASLPPSCNRQTCREHLQRLGMSRRKWD